MYKTNILLSLIGAIITGYLAVVFWRLSALDRKLKNTENTIIELYYNKINKLPALVEIMKLHTLHGDICTEMIRLHRATIITRMESVYDILELNRRIQREFVFLMKVSAKIKDLHRNGNFLYIRDFMTFYELSIHKSIQEYNREVYAFNKLVVMKNFSIVGILIPLSKRLTI